MLRRRKPMDSQSPETRKPSSSGPRRQIILVIAARVSWGKGLPRFEIVPTNPHMVVSLSFGAPGELGA